MSSDAFADLAAYTDLPRVTGLALAPDGTRLVAVVARPDEDGARNVPALWEIPLDGGAPSRLTHSAKGESEPAFLPDGTLLFTSARDGGNEDADEPALWALPPAGEARLLARRPGGLRQPTVAAAAGTVLLGGSRLPYSTEADDAQRRTTRKKRRVSAILHTGMPIRHWDHELGVEWPRLLRVDPASGAPGASLQDLLPDATGELAEASWTVSADGSTAALGWRPRRPCGAAPWQVALLDLASGARSMLAADEGWQFRAPVISPDGRLVALGQERDGSFETPFATSLAIADAHTGERVAALVGDLEPTEWAWSTDSATVFVAGDLHGRGAVVALDPATGEVRRRLAADAAYSDLHPAPDGSVYALRSAVDAPPAPVRLDASATDQQPQLLPTPAPCPPLPGTVEELLVPTADGAQVHAWLFLPAPGERPAPLMTWIHGGPFLSANAWSWRWNPWVAVAHGWAVVLPDPALSTGYGPGWIERAWPYRAAQVWRDVQTVLDDVVRRPDVDAQRLALLGGSFGGFMTNWIAGHTQRFGAIVTHAGLWALDQQHATTDNAHFKTAILERPEDRPDWYAANSPHHTADAIATPMLVIHGNRDYRVPVSEALRLWWDLVSRWTGDPAQLPHRFLQFTAENHWVLAPADVQVWYDAVLGFCGQHVLGEPWTPTPLL